jgi:hypothetical protein
MRNERYLPISFRNDQYRLQAKQERLRRLAGQRQFALEAMEPRLLLDA